MVRHDFQCEKCGNIQEEYHSIKDDPKSLKCEKCGSKKLNKMFTTGTQINMNDNKTTPVNYGKRK